MSKRTLTPSMYIQLVTAANKHLDSLGRYADEAVAHRANRDRASMLRSSVDVAIIYSATQAAVAEVALWSDLDDSEHAETIAELREALHACEVALGLGSAREAA